MSSLFAVVEGQTVTVGSGGWFGAFFLLFIPVGLMLGTIIGSWATEHPESLRLSHYPKTKLGISCVRARLTWRLKSGLIFLFFGERQPPLACAEIQAAAQAASFGTGMSGELQSTRLARFRVMCRLLPQKMLRSSCGFFFLMPNVQRSETPARRRSL